MDAIRLYKWNTRTHTYRTQTQTQSQARTAPRRYGNITAKTITVSLPNNGNSFVVHSFEANTHIHKLTLLWYNGRINRRKNPDKTMKITLYLLVVRAAMYTHCVIVCATVLG